MRHYCTPPHPSTSLWELLTKLLFVRLYNERYWPATRKREVQHWFFHLGILDRFCDLLLVVSKRHVAHLHRACIGLEEVLLDCIPLLCTM